MDEEENIKKLLSDADIEISDEDLKENITKIQYLIEIWLDSLEKQIFDGKTLQELLASSDI